jgi:hypothetical protein
VLLAAGQVTVHVHTDSGPLTAVAAVAALIAAAVAVGGLIYARRTVSEAKNTLTEIKAAREEGIVLRRITQLQRARELTIELRDLADRATPSNGRRAEPMWIVEARIEARSRLRPVGAQLSAVLAALDALHGPPLADLAQLAREAEQGTREPIQIISKAHEAIEHIAALFAEPHPTLRLSPPTALDGKAD